MRRLLLRILLGCGIILGVYHLLLAGKALFVARNEEPLWFWLFLLSGPLTTLPASLTAFFEPRIGAIWLITGGIVSFMAALGDPSNRDMYSVSWFLALYSGPLLLLGVVATTLAKHK